jgi:tRNA(adenine34) deaminase
METKKRFMENAIEAAKISAKNKDYPIGSVIVKNNKIISIGYEKLKSDKDPVNGHAEIDAIRKACKKIKKPYLEKCALYSTHEPCPMCASAAVWSKIKVIVYGISRKDLINHMKKKSDKSFSWRQINISCKEILKKEKPNSKIKLIQFMKKECLKLLEIR